MSIQRWDPFREMMSLRDAVNRLLEESFVSPSLLMGTRESSFPVDIEETDDNFVLRASLPGYKPEEINVSITGDTLTISAEHKEEGERREGSYLVRERRLGKVTRTFTLPTRISGDQASAKYENGELVLTLPKAEESKPRRIQITTGAQTSQPSIEPQSTTQ
ncbi:heat shock protein Hsp20 [Thermobaculum terrenum ATCC BAA-798]|uniref:Heat shock protein Hsp20 n=1 Tax=Thermobaculum terrenum (strain ATCC BAA-798 / CCMEE 7001 / YNP1) TaxID=525904 RepID=D1CEV1_THET1|nr:Hsp20/alpha crystallin family protein [Thermobaculum terrenum]ACZ41457.1 heat shock protein Hsp20 [Thermobaculum terrenum ATCC BAA-798]